MTSDEQWVTGWMISAVCTRNEFGGTEVQANFMGSPMKLITFKDYDVDRDGFDGLRLRIQSEVGDQIEAALRLAS